MSALPPVDIGRDRGVWWRDLHTDGEEWFNGLTHALGFLLGLIGSGVLLLQAARGGLSWSLFSCVIYCLSLVGVYAASTLSHWIRDPTWRHRFRSWDQGMIFLLIVATFTPFAVTFLSGPWMWLTGFLWVLAIAGFVSKVIHTHCVDGIVLWLYVALGWLPVFALPTLWPMAPNMVLLVLGGGIIYTAGAFLLMNDHRQRYLHMGWHLFVIAGSAVHFLAIYTYVLPRLG